MANKYFSKLNQSNGTFSDMMKNGFGVVTVMMNAKVYKIGVDTFKTSKNAYTFVKELKADDLLCELDTLKIANVSVEGPTKTISGGQYSNPLIKFGKSARLEMQDALGSAEAIDALCGGVREWDGDETGKKGTLTVGLHIGEDFNAPVTIVGDSFFIDRVTGQQVPVKIVFYQFLPDSIFNLTQDAEGDATVFDMNGDLLTTNIIIGDQEGSAAGIKHGVFYSIIDPNEIDDTEGTNPEN